MSDPTPEEVAAEVARMDEQFQGEPAPVVEEVEHPTHTFPVSLQLFHATMHMPRSMEITEIRPPEVGEGELLFGATFPPGIVMVTVTGPGVPEDLEDDAVPIVSHQPETHTWTWTEDKK